MRRTLIITAVALGASATPAAAAAAEQPQTALFRVEVSGVQTTTWSLDHPGLGGCDTDTTGSGTERVRFSSRPVKVRATLLKSLSAPVLTPPTGAGVPVVKLRGRVTRQGSVSVAEGGECGGGEGEQLAPDCGTKSFAGVKLPIDYRLSARPRDQLDVRPEGGSDLFARCPSGGYSFPTLVSTNGGAPMRTELPRAELFDRELGKIIVVAQGREADANAEDTYDTRIRWEIAFTRIG